MNTDTNTITIIPGADGAWHAQFGGSHRAAVVADCGTDCIPTPYRLAMPVGKVASLLAARNPGVAIRHG